MGDREIRRETVGTQRRRGREVLGLWQLSALPCVENTDKRKDKEEEKFVFKRQRDPECIYTLPPLAQLVLSLLSRVRHPTFFKLYAAVCTERRIYYLSRYLRRYLCLFFCSSGAPAQTPFFPGCPDPDKPCTRPLSRSPRRPGRDRQIERDRYSCTTRRSGCTLRCTYT